MKTAFALSDINKSPLLADTLLGTESMESPNCGPVGLEQSNCAEVIGLAQNTHKVKTRARRTQVWLMPEAVWLPADKGCWGRIWDQIKEDAWQGRGGSLRGQAQDAERPASGSEQVTEAWSRHVWGRDRARFWVGSNLKASFILWSRW